MAAGFRYTPPGGSLTTHTLARKLQMREGAAAVVKTRYRNIALDQRAIDVVTIEGGAEELDTVVRTDPSPLSLLTMIDHGAAGVTLNYYPDLSLGTFYPFVLMSPFNREEIRRDRDRFALQEYEVRLLLRRVDGGSIAGLLSFELGPATFTRASTATYVEEV